jgi:hypothetical protein
MTTQNTQTFHKGWTRRLREAILDVDDDAMVGALNQNANPDGKIAGGQMSFLDHAAAHHHSYGVALLLEYGAVADAKRVRYLARTKGEIGFFPIHMAVYRGYIKALTRLLDARVEVDVLCPTGRATALMMAAMAGSADMARLLLAAGADIEHRTDRGATPLWFACQLMWVDVARLLLGEGAEIDVEAHVEGMAEGETMSLLEMVSGGPDDIQSLIHHHKGMRSASALEMTLAQPTPSVTTRRARM